MTELSAGCHEGNSFAGLSGLQLYELRLPADGPFNFKSQGRNSGEQMHPFSGLYTLGVSQGVTGMMERLHTLTRLQSHQCRSAWPF